MLPASIDMQTGTVDLVWCNSFDLSQDRLKELKSFLSQSELNRVDSAKTEMVRRTRLVASGMLREQLALLLELAPQSISFEVPSPGKLSAPQLERHVKFNIAHSNWWVVLAISQGFEVGVDLEKIQAEYVTNELVNTAMTEQEYLNWQSQDSDRVCAFFKHWVRKEAVLKGSGAGIESMKDCLLKEGERALMKGQWWQVIDLPAPPGFAAALAAEILSPGKT